MPSTNLSFRTPAELMDKIKARDLKGVDNPGATAKRDLSRWYEFLTVNLGEVKLQPDEAAVLIYYVGKYQGAATQESVVNASTIIEADDLGLSEDLDDARGSLARKMDSWFMGELYAAWDAAERYQVLVERVDPDEDLTFGMALHKVGLHNYHLTTEKLALVEAMNAVVAEDVIQEYTARLSEVARG